MKRIVILVAALAMLLVAASRADEATLWGHWPLAGDANDHSGHHRHAAVRGPVDFSAAGPAGASRTAAAFNGRDTLLEVPPADAASQGDFSLAAWVYTDAALDDVPGDMVSCYQPARRRGFHLSLKNNAGVANSQANDRQLTFGIDDNRETTWTDCGRPGNAILAFALTVHDGALYAGTCEPGANQSGRVYRLDGAAKWIDCGAPDRANAVTAMATLDGQLYAGTGKYRLAGSALTESPNETLGGGIYRYDGEGRWTDCGRLPGVEAIGGMVVYRGQLYASSLYRPAGFFRYDGGTAWTDCGTPGKRVEALGVFNGYIYATSYDGGLVFRYDGSTWTDCGQLGSAEENTQTYSFAVYQGRLFVGTWRTGRVYRFEDLGRWTDVGRLGEELEVMGMLVHNGRLLAGTLPLAEVYSYEGDTTWRRLARLDHTPDVRYRRAWTMAEFAGRVFCSTLPTGQVYSYEAGQNVSWDHAFPAGWHHVAAVRAGDRLRLYIDGRQASESSPLTGPAIDLKCDSPLRIGFGANDYFKGRLADVRLYRGALSAADIQQLSRKR
ncbi:MAG: LamG-like jellyroll fold domain-containing protein [Pirellulales bacterium]